MLIGYKVCASHEEMLVQINQVDLKQREELDLAANKLKHDLDLIFRKYQDVVAEVTLQRLRTAELLSEARSRLPEPFATDELRAIAGEDAHLLDAFYASFDEQFRGSREEIKQRLGIYLPILSEHRLGGADMPILDVGCGRGEWLELLLERQ